jgi:hypothetical protein
LRVNVSKGARLEWQYGDLLIQSVNSYTNAHKSIDATLADLSQLVGDNPAQLQRLSSLRDDYAHAVVC